MWQIIKLIQSFMSLHVTCKNEKIHSKMKVLEWAQKISHCKSMQVFYYAQGQFTPQSAVGSTLSSNLSKFYGCPCYLQK